jgi:hypothetical protein
MIETERCRRPCGNCPWRKDAPTEYWDAGHFREIWVNCQDDGLHVMACHYASQVAAPADKPICQGWVRVMGFAAIGVRIAFVKGRVTEREIEDREGPELYESFEAMLRANKVTPPARNHGIRDAASLLQKLTSKKGSSSR